MAWVIKLEPCFDRMCSSNHWHTIFRANWHYSKKDGTELETFRYLNKLLDRGHKSYTEKVIKFKNDVEVRVPQLVSDLNTLRDYVNDGMVCEKENVMGALLALIFRMTTVTQF